VRLLKKSNDAKWPDYSSPATVLVATKRYFSEATYAEISASSLSVMVSFGIDDSLSTAAGLRTMYAT
jgi:hypothetical protein